MISVPKVKVCDFHTRTFFLLPLSDPVTSVSKVRRKKNQEGKRLGGNKGQRISESTSDNITKTTITPRYITVFLKQPLPNYSEYRTHLHASWRHKRSDQHHYSGWSLLAANKVQSDVEIASQCQRYIVPDRHSDARALLPIRILLYIFTYGALYVYIVRYGHYKLYVLTYLLIVDKTYGSNLIIT